MDRPPPGRPRRLALDRHPVELQPARPPAAADGAQIDHLDRLLGTILIDPRVLGKEAVRDRGERRRRAIGGVERAAELAVLAGEAQIDLEPDDRVGGAIAFGGQRFLGLGAQLGQDHAGRRLAERR